MILYTKDRKVVYNSATVPPNDLLKCTFLNTDARINVEDFGKPNSISKAWLAYLHSDVTWLEPTPSSSLGNLSPTAWIFPSVQLATRWISPAILGRPITSAMVEEIRRAENWSCRLAN